MTINDISRERALIAQLSTAGVRVYDKIGGLDVDRPGTDELMKIASQLERLDSLFAVHSAGEPVLTGPELRHLDGHKKLREINISWMPISGKHYVTFPTLPNLQVLVCSLEKDVKEGMTHIGKCKRLRDLSVYGSEVTDESLDLLRELESLEQLRLPGSPVSFGVHVVKHMKCLQELDLEDTRIHDDVLGTLSQLPNLEQLYMGSPIVTNAGIAHLANCPKLRTLTINCERVDSNGIANLTRLPPLRYLSLHAKMSTSMINTLSEMKQLTELSCDGEGASDATEARLAKALPKCKVNCREPKAKE